MGGWLSPRSLAPPPARPALAIQASRLGSVWPAEGGGLGGGPVATALQQRGDGGGRGGAGQEEACGGCRSTQVDDSGLAWLLWPWPTPDPRHPRQAAAAGSTGYRLHRPPCHFLATQPSKPRAFASPRLASPRAPCRCRARPRSTPRARPQQQGRGVGTRASERVCHQPASKGPKCNSPLRLPAAWAPTHLPR